MVENHVAVAVGIGHAALVPEQRRISAGNVEQIVAFLDAPPRVFAQTRIVVRDDAGIHGRGIGHVAEVIFQRAIARSIGGNFDVTVKCAAQDAQLGAAVLRAIAATLIPYGTPVE